MICTSIAGKDFAQIQQLLSKGDIELAEIRLDSCSLTEEQIEELFSESELPLIATCRLDGNNSQEQVCSKLSAAIKAGARFADLELDAPSNLSRRIQKLCKEYGVELIRSYHNFEQTPEPELLSQILQRCYRYGAAIAKIATQPREAQDIKHILNLYKEAPHGKLIAFCLSDEARETRMYCLKQGAPFSYACPDAEEQTAPGQWTQGEMTKAIYGQCHPYQRSGLKMPASKSFAQRAIIAAALSQGTSTLGKYTDCDDSRSAIKVAQALGAEVSQTPQGLVIKGIGPLTEPLKIDSINAGESGLLARLMIPLMSTIGPGNVTITGEGTLLQRPLEAASDILAAFGVMVSNEESSKGKTIFIPAKVSGKLIPGLADVPGRGGSQLISGLLMSLPLCNKPSTLYVGEPKSLPYMFIIQDLLRRFGIKIDSELEGNARMLEEQDWSGCSGVTFKIPGSQSYKSASFDLEADWSAAANYLVAGAVFGSVEIDNLDCSSLQADLSILDILVEAGASVSATEDGRVCVCKAPLEAFNADLNNAPDLFPIVSVLAAFCCGQSRLSGLRRLHTKESDRAAAIQEMLTALGVKYSVEEDDMLIEGETLCSRILNSRLLSGGEISSHHDHRMVMALKVAGLGAQGRIMIDNESCLSKSFPGFDLFN